MELRQRGAAVTIASAGYDIGGSDPDVTSLSNGNLVVVWSENLGQPSDQFDDTDGAVFMRVLDSSGTPISEIVQINESQIFLQDRPQIIALASGGFTVGFTHSAQYGDHPTDQDVFVRFFQNDGTVISNFGIDVVQDTPSTLFGHPTDMQVLRQMVVLSGNRFAVLLEEPASAQASGTNYGTFIYDSSGLLRSRLADDVDDMVQLANGNILRAARFATDDEPDTHYIRLILSDERFEGPAGLAGIYEPLSFYIDAVGGRALGENSLELAALGGGGFALAYIEERDAGTSVINLKLFSDQTAQQYAASLIPRSLSFDGENGEFDMLSLSGGGIALAMVVTDTTDGSQGVDLLLFDEDGRMQGDVINVGLSDVGDQGMPSLTELPDGTIALAYTDDGSANGNPLQIAFFSVSDPREQLVGTEGDDVLGGLGGRDRILGLAGDDEITGRAGDDILRGDEGADILYGRAGHDALRGGAGNDLLKGGKGNDGLGGGAGEDRLLGEAGHDILGGGGGNDILLGGSGDDVLKGGGASDTLTGGANSDTFVFINGHGGQDMITDFSAAEDSILIELRGAEASDLTVASDGGNTTVVLDAVDIILSGVILDESDISFQFI